LAYFLTFNHLSEAKEKWLLVDNVEEPSFELMIRKLIAICVVTASSISLAQTIAEPRGEASLVFGLAGGKWQKVMITDALTGELSTAYSLEAEASATDIETGRHPRIAFYCQKSGEFDHVRIRTGTVVANQSHSVSDDSVGSARVSIRSDDHEAKMWNADIAKNGSDLLAGKSIISDFLAHKKIDIRFVTASGNTITDEYLTDGLSRQSLKADCPSFFKGR
jgi:hypothetical protein